jgi:hypothetical protein
MIAKDDALHALARLGVDGLDAQRVRVPVGELGVELVVGVLAHALENTIGQDAREPCRTRRPCEWRP